MLLVGAYASGFRNPSSHLITHMGDLLGHIKCIDTWPFTWETTWVQILPYLCNCGYRVIISRLHLLCIIISLHAFHIRFMTCFLPMSLSICVSIGYHQRHSNIQCDESESPQNYKIIKFFICLVPK